MVFQQAEEELARLNATAAALEDRLSDLNVLVQDVRDRVAALEGDEVPVPDPEPEPLPVTTGVWISADELQALPMSGPEWESLKKAADSAPDAPAILADQDGVGDLNLLAVALVAARTGAANYRDKAMSMFNQTIAIDYRADSAHEPVRDGA